MSEPEEIPEKIMKAAFQAIWDAADVGPCGGLPDESCETFAKVALEAAGVPEMLARIAGLSKMVVERNSEIAFILQDKNQRIAELEAANAKLKARLGKELGWVNN